VKRTRLEDIVAFLRFSGAEPSHARFRNTSERNWTSLLQWLDDSGMAFYFLQKLQDEGATASIPGWLLSLLEQDFLANQQRNDCLSQRFAFLNRMFDSAGLKYAVLKGFSHVPQFCPNAALRHQGDLDYLVDDRSLPTAQRLLEAAGYRLKPPISDQEFVYLLTGVEEPRHGRCYAPEFHAVELHLDVWDSDLNRLPMMDRLFSVERTAVRRIGELSFPALTEQDAFLLQVLHTCGHLFTYWIRMSCLYEIGYFFTRRASDAAFWNQVAERVGDNYVLQELTVVVSELVAKLFAAPLPQLIQEWGQAVRPAIRVWIDNYAQQCAFSDLPVYRFSPFPQSKLILFLHQQYEGLCAEQHLVRNQLIVPTRLGRMRRAVREKPSLLLSRKWWKRQRVVRRGMFHVLSGMRYAVEIPRWRWLNQRQARAVSSARDLLNRPFAAKAKSA
jgi:hypothetical protein